MYYKACICEYRGTAYSGWQRQPNGRSIQGILEDILSQIYNEPIRIAGSGRTDAGVHALGQVFSFSAANHRTDQTVVWGINSLLPLDIAVYKAWDTDSRFHAGRSAVSKTYIYKIINRAIHPALESDRAMWLRKEIDIDKLNRVLAFFEGTQDFSSVCVKKTKRDNCTRTINYARASRTGDIIDVEINASGFLHNMVRIIVGTAIGIVAKDEPAEKVVSILESKDRRQAGVTAPACGLYQKAVFY